MYERQFGLRENPFAAGHQSKYVYPSREHQEALAHLRFGIENREAFVLITGEVGTGKTTALYDALTEWKSRAVVALITNTALTRSELYEEICMRFGVPIAGPTSKPQLIQQLERHLMVVRARGDYAILLIDEAQNLDGGLLEETRLLSNLEAQGQKLLQIFLVGQPELEAMLERPELRQLRQRIAVHYQLRPLSPEETERYIHHRITVAGGNALTVFPADACAEVHAATHGIPREINTVAAQALLNAFVEDSNSVKPEHVRAILSDTGFRSVLDRPAAPEAAAPTTESAPSPPVTPPAAVSPVPVSPSRDVPAPTREARQVPAPVPPNTRPATPAANEAEGRPMAGVRPAGSTESWQSWMESLAKFPVPNETENAEAPAPEAETGEPAPAADATASEGTPTATPEMSPAEFYAVEEEALRSPIGDFAEDLGEEYGDEVEEEEAGYSDETGEEGEEVEPGDEESQDDEIGDEESEYEEAGDDVADDEDIEDDEAGDDEPQEEDAEVEDESEPVTASAAESGKTEPPVDPDFESDPGIQWGHVENRSADFEDARMAEAMGDTPSGPAATPAPAEPEPAFMEAARNFAPLPPASAARPVEFPAPATGAAAPREPAVARVSAAPARPLAAAQAMPIRLRERLEAAERGDSTPGGRMTGWLIGAAALAVVTIGVLFALRMRSQAEIDARARAEATPTSSGSVATSDDAQGTEPVQESTPPETNSAAADPTPAPETPVAATTPPPAPKTPRSATTSSAPNTPVTTSPAVVAPVVPTRSEPKPAATPKPAASKVEYGVSVASFLAEGRAQSELARLSAATGISGRVVATPDGDYRVILGSYPDRDAAEGAAGKLIDSGKVDEARVVPLGSGSKN